MPLFVQEDNKGEAGKPWIGFAVRTIRGRPGVYVCDVVEGGPAHTAGLRDEDVLVSFGKIRVDDMNGFREAMKVAKKPGKSVVVVGRRGRDEEFRVNVKIGVKKRVIIEDVPPLTTLDEVRAVLRDPAKLQKVAEAAFAAADTDCSGLVTQAEFIEAMRTWLGPSFTHFLSDKELIANFGAVDTDGSNFLGKREFPVLVQGMLTDMLRNMNVVSDALTATIGGPERPWLGFSVTKPRGRKQVLIQDVEPSSPGTQAGLAAGDQILSLGGTRITTLIKFNEYLSKHLRPDLPLVVKFKRLGRPYTTRLIVGARESTIYKNVRDSYTTEEVNGFRNDAESFAVIAEHLFGKGDERGVGIIEASSVLTLLRGWGTVTQNISEDTLREIISMHDFDESGYVNKAQFYQVLRTLLNLSCKWEESYKSPSMVVRRKKYPLPVPTGSVTAEWHTRGFTGGTFKTAGHRSWLRNTNAEHWPHMFIAVHDNLIVEKVHGTAQREVLEPGDEIFIPAGTTYDVTAKNEDYVQFMFALCLNCGLATDTSATLTLLQQEIQPPSKRHASLGFRVGSDAMTKQLKVTWVGKTRDMTQSGIAVGDTLVSIDTVPIATKKDFQDACRRCVIGQLVRVEVLKGGEPLVAFVPAIMSRHSVTFSDETTVNSLEALETVLSDKKKLKSFSKACFVGCDATGRGVVDRDMFVSRLHATLDVPAALGGALEDAELLSFFDKADTGAATYVTEGEFQKMLQRVLEKVHQNALVVEAQSRPPIEELPPSPRPQRPGKRAARSRKNKGKVLRKKVAGARTAKAVVTRTMVTTRTAKKRAGGRSSSSKRAAGRRDNSATAALSPWGRKSEVTESHEVVTTSTTTSAQITMAPRSKAGATAVGRIMD